MMESQSVRIAGESGRNKGYDASTNVSGRKRHLLVDASGLLLAVSEIPANISDNRGARELLSGFAPSMPRPERIWADVAYAGEQMWAASTSESGISVVL